MNMENPGLALRDLFSRLFVLCYFAGDSFVPNRHSREFGHSMVSHAQELLPEFVGSTLLSLPFLFPRFLLAPALLRLD